MAFDPPMDEISLQKLAAANPVASVLTFAHLTENFRTNLLGYSSDRSSNLSMLMPPTSLTPQEDGVAEPEHKRMRGVFGVCTLNRDVKECNKRAAMHELLRLLCLLLYKTQCVFEKCLISIVNLILYILLRSSIYIFLY